MAKTNQIKKLVNGEIADADDVNQIAENVGAEGGLIPYDPTTHARETNGTESLGSTNYPWGSLYANREAELVEVDPNTNTAASQVSIQNLRKFLYLKDVFESSYSGSAGLNVRVNDGETGLEFSSGAGREEFFASGSWVCPNGVNMVWVTMIGAGGGGSDFDNNNHSGGASGAYVINMPIIVTPGNTYTITVGAGGAAGSGGAGTTGGLSSISGSGITTLTCNGGQGGQDGTNSTGGTISGNNTNICFSGAGTDGVTAGSPSWVGADSQFGSGGSPGSEDATGYGAGGSAGRTAVNTPGDGSDGFVILRW